MVCWQQRGGQRERKSGTRAEDRAIVNEPDSYWCVFVQSEKRFFPLVSLSIAEVFRFNLEVVDSLVGERGVAKQKRRLPVLTATPKRVLVAKTDLT